MISKDKSIDIKTVNYIADLARIALSQEEAEILSHQLKEILDFIDRLKEINIEDMPATTHILEVKNVLREDILRPSISSAKVLDMAPLKKDNFFVVPKIIE
ncbi:MAG: Asp-tRNA(Asn)/Glu-tRNA(Gln) amidotransferase subunit GatC [Candidatus Omnitrophica bacterium]|nr:Asp-tRNA(Asn)/Glu-tRNA(Gln) amidotransferase subunit GatC [Candidatus Omnitrophota bacterium]